MADHPVLTGTKRVVEAMLDLADALKRLPPEIRAHSKEDVRVILSQHVEAFFGAESP